MTLFLLYVVFALCEGGSGTTAANDTVPLIKIHNTGFYEIMYMYFKYYYCLRMYTVL